MSVEKLRHSFTVYVIDTEEMRSRSVVGHLRAAGYTCLYFKSGESAIESFQQSPPHMVFFHYKDRGVGDPFFIQRILRRAPETHIFVFTTPENYQEAQMLYENGIEGCLMFSYLTSRELVKCADRMARFDIQVYQNEDLRAQKTQKKAEEAGGVLSLHNVWLSQLEKMQNLDEAITLFIRETSRKSAGTPVLFFKYIRAYQTLVLTQSEQVEASRTRGIGLDLGSEENRIPVAELRKPQTLPLLQDLMRDVFTCEKYLAFPFEADGEFRGIFVYMLKENGEIDEPYIRISLKALSLAATRIQLEKRLHNTNFIDAATQTFSRSHFLQRLGEEFSRARRIGRPVSLVVISLDQIEQLQKREPREVDMVVKSLAAILKKTSRINDLVGRLGPGELALILPHTGQKGATIKAERLRRIIEGADFSKVSNQFARITVSMGVSEYPSLSHDTEEILRSADHALGDVKRSGANRVCLASAPRGFVPDFFVK